MKYVDLDGKVGANGKKVIDRGNNTLSDMGDMTIIGDHTPRYQYTINGF